MIRRLLSSFAVFLFLAGISPAQNLVAQSVTLPGGTAANICGIGAVVADQGGQTVIRECLAGSGAQTAGLLADDVIITVNGTEITGLDLEAIVGMIRGEADTTVLLRVGRVGVQPFDVLVTRHPVRP